MIKEIGDVISSRGIDACRAKNGTEYPLLFRSKAAPSAFVTALLGQDPLVPVASR
jgi:hypothetical protein